MRQQPTTSAKTTTPSAQTAPGAPTTVQGIPPANAELDVLQNALGELRVQEAGLKAQSVALKRQLDGMRLDNPARPGVQQQAANIGVQLSQVQGNIAIIQARIDQKEGRPVGEPRVIVNPRPPRTGPDPDMVAGLSLGIIMIVAVPLSIAYARRIWRGKPAPGIPRGDEIPGRLERLEHAVDTIAIEVERISEGQRFITKILAERPAQQPASSEDGRPILALGAGPIEQVRVNERQGVKQSNTPH